MAATRDVSWIVQQFRQFLLGRKLNSQLRFKGVMSNRSPPPPIIPGGEAHKLSDNSYVSRDRRRLVTAPTQVNIVHQGKNIEAKVGETLMSAARRAGIGIEAACEGSLACSTCHVYIDEKSFKKLPPATDAEEDMLDLALFVQPTSRLSCQIVLSSDLNNIELKLPAATRNFYVDKPKHDSD